MSAMTSDGVEAARAEFPAMGRVLIVGDHSRDLQIYSVGLLRQGYAVRECTSFSEALRRLESESFEFIVLSQQPNRLEGQAILKYATEARGYAPVLVLRPPAGGGNYAESTFLASLEHFRMPLAAEIVWLVNSLS